MVKVLLNIGYNQIRAKVAACELSLNLNGAKLIPDDINSSVLFGADIIDNDGRNSYQYSNSVGPLVASSKIIGDEMVAATSYPHNRLPHSVWTSKN